jgi:hypothetical protein
MVEYAPLPGGAQAMSPANHSAHKQLFINLLLSF